MIDRRSQGLYHLHALLAGLEAAAVWTVMAATSPWVSWYNYYSLLDPWSYRAAIFAGVLLAMRVVMRTHENLLTLGWVASLQLGFRQAIGVTAGVFALAVATKDAGLSRLFVACYLPVLWMALTLVNRFQPALLARAFVRRAGDLPMLLMGREENFPGLDHWLAGQRRLGLQAVGVIAYGAGPGGRGALPVVGAFEDLEQVLARTRARQILMLELPRSAPDAERIVRACASHGCRLMIHNNLVVQLDRPLHALSYHGYSFLALHDEPLENFANRALKRALDIAVSLPVVVLLIPPLMLVVRLFQAWQSPGPLFYTQERAGQDGRPFRIWKFRSMHVAADARRQAEAGDQRVFPFGRWLRRTSLDEVPQFWNVLTGDMSVVGPRPHLESQEDMFRRSAEVYRMRFFVKPGITGLAQAHGLRGEARDSGEIERRIRADVTYIRSWSLWLDLAIMARTAGQILRPPKSAYRAAA